MVNKAQIQIWSIFFFLFFFLFWCIYENPITSQKQLNEIDIKHFVSDPKVRNVPASTGHKVIRLLCKYVTTRVR